MSLEKGVDKFVEDGCTVTFGGNNGRNTFAPVYEVIRKGIKNLHIIDENSLTGEDMLVGAGCVDKLETSWVGISMMDFSYRIRDSIVNGVPHKIEMVDYTNYTGCMRFFAGAIGMPFLPVKSMVGTDIPKYNNDIKVIDDPFGGEKIALVPAAKPDVAFIPVQKADKRGNAQIWGHRGTEDIRARAAENTVVLCEELVTTDEIRENPNMTIVPSYVTDAVVEVPYNCHPWDCYGYYYYDLPFTRDYGEKAESYEGFQDWLDEWVYSVESFEEYCDKVGWKRLERLSEMGKKLNKIQNMKGADNAEE